MGRFETNAPPSALKRPSFCILQGFRRRKATQRTKGSEQVSGGGNQDFVGDWKRRLQIRGAGGRSRKRPTLVVDKKPNGKCQVKDVDPFDLPGALLHEYMGGGEHESAFTTSKRRPTNRIHLD